MSEEENSGNGVTIPTEREAYEVNHLSEKPGKVRRFIEWLANPSGKTVSATTIATATALSNPIGIYAEQPPNPDAKPSVPGLFDSNPYEKEQPGESAKIIPPLVFDLNKPDTLIKIGEPIEIHPSKPIEIILTDRLKQGIEPGFETIPVGGNPIKSLIKTMSLSEYNAFRYGESNTRRLARLTPEQLKTELQTIVIREDDNIPWQDGAEFQIKVIDPQDPENKLTPAIVTPTIRIIRYQKKF